MASTGGSSMFRYMVKISAAALLALSLAAAPELAAPQSSSTGRNGQATQEDVTRSTLDNGMRVVIIRDPLAPVVTVEENYLAGGDETPAGFPGMAHAQEHMAFRGCTDLSGDQTSALY